MHVVGGNFELNRKKTFFCLMLLITATLLFLVLFRAAPAHAATSNVKYLNAFQIKATCDGGNCAFATNTLALSDSMTYSRRGDISSTSADKITFIDNSDPGAGYVDTNASWYREYTTTSAGASVPHSDKISIGNESAYALVGYSDDAASTIKAISGASSGGTWNKATGKLPNGYSQVYVNTADGDQGCPSIIAQSSSGQWGFIAPRKAADGNYRSDAGSTEYRALLTAAGKPNMYGACMAGGDMDGNKSRQHNESTLATQFGGESSYWRNSAQHASNAGMGNISGNGGLFYIFKSKPFGKGSDILLKNGDIYDDNTQEGCTGLGGVWDVTRKVCTGANKDTPQEPNSAAAAAPADKTCQLGTLGWILCPVLDGVTMAVDAIMGWLDSQLDFQWLNNDDSFKSIRSVWNTVLNVANIAFAIVFLILIYSQATGGGLTAYSVRKILPRLLVGAILVNISLYFCIVLVDASNIVGASVGTFFNNMTQSSLGNSLADLGGGSSGNWFGGFLAGLGGLAIGIAIIATGALSAVLIAIFIVYFSILARQVILIVLIIISPLAFVAWILPNTDKWFKKWLNLFIQMLLVYPFILGLFNVAKFLSSLILSTTARNTAGVEQFGWILAAIAVIGAPVIMLPKIFSMTSGMLGKLQGAGGKIGKAIGLGAAGGLATKAAKNSTVARGFRERRSLKEAEKQKAFSRRVAGSRYNPMAVMARGGPAITPMGRQVRRGQAARAAGVAHEATQKDIANEQIVIARDMEAYQQKGGDQFEFLDGQMKEAVSKGQTSKARAIQNQYMSMGGAGQDRLARVLSSRGVVQSLNDNRELKASVQSDLATTHWAKAKEGHAALAQFGAGGIHANMADAYNTKASGRLKPSEIASNTPASIRAMSGAVPPTTFQEMIADKDIMANVNRDQREMIEFLAGTGPDPYRDLAPESVPEILPSYNRPAPPPPA